jgi:excisionase family DNA binding protein
LNKVSSQLDSQLKELLTAAAGKIAYTLPECAHLSGLSYQILYRSVRSGTLPSLRVGRRRRSITRQALENFLNYRQENPPLRGFSLMRVRDPARLRELGIRAGKLVRNAKRLKAPLPPRAPEPARLNARRACPFADDRQLARSAGSKGGTNIPADKRWFSRNPEAARAAGLKGGAARRAKQGIQTRDVIPK